MSSTKIQNIIKSLTNQEIIWLYDLCSIVIFGHQISNVSQINDFFLKRGIKKIRGKKSGILFAEDKWFMWEIFNEYSKRGYIVTGRHYDSIKSYNY